MVSKGALKKGSSLTEIVGPVLPEYKPVSVPSSSVSSVWRSISVKPWNSPPIPLAPEGL